MAKSCEYVVCIGFEANVAIRAKSEDEALETARKMLDERAVFRTEDIYNESAEIPEHDGDFFEREPLIVEVREPKPSTALDDIVRFCNDIRWTVNNTDMTDKDGRSDVRRDVEIRLQNIEGRVKELRDEDE